MDNIEATKMAFTVSDNTNTTHVVATSNNGDVTRLKLDKVLNLAGLEIVPNSVIGTDQRVGVADSTAIVGNDVGNTLGADLKLADLAELVLGFLVRNAMDSETALDVVQETEVFASLLNLDDVHESSRVVGIGANLAVNLDRALHNNAVNFALVQSVLQTVAKQNNNGKALAQLVRSRGRSGGKSSR